MTKRSDEKTAGGRKKGGRERPGSHDGDLLLEDRIFSEENAESGADENGDNGKGVLKTIVRQAKKGEAKQQELYLKYIDVFNKTGKDEDDEEVVYETEFVDDKDKKD